MSQVDCPPRIYVSGERVPPGTYRDVASGAVVRLLEPDSLPEDIRIVKSMRLYERLNPHPLPTLPGRWERGELEEMPCGRHSG